MNPTRRLTVSLVIETGMFMNVQSPHKWWSTLTSVVFCSSSALPPLVSERGGLVCESIGKADLLSALPPLIALPQPYHRLLYWPVIAEPFLAK